VLIGSIDRQAAMVRIPFHRTGYVLGLGAAVPSTCAAEAVIGALLGRKVELSRWNTAGEEISAPLASNLLWLGSTARLCEVTKVELARFAAITRLEEDTGEGQIRARRPLHRTVNPVALALKFSCP
jgi:hypothetical protein